MTTYYAFTAYNTKGTRYALYYNYAAASLVAQRFDQVLRQIEWTVGDVQGFGDGVLTEIEPNVLEYLKVAGRSSAYQGWEVYDGAIASAKVPFVIWYNSQDKPQTSINAADKSVTVIGAVNGVFVQLVMWDKGDGSATQPVFWAAMPTREGQALPPAFRPLYFTQVE